MLSASHVIEDDEINTERLDKSPLYDSYNLEILISDGSVYTQLYILFSIKAIHCYMIKYLNFEK